MTAKVPKSAAIFRAWDVIALDYPYRDAIEAALVFVDECIVVVNTRSRDNTLSQIMEVARRNSGNVVVAPLAWRPDRMWQQRAWEHAVAHTDAEWLFWLDLDELIEPRHYDAVRDAMANPDTQLVSFPFVHFYGTSSWTAQLPVRRNTRLGRRSAGYRMVNACSDENPSHACCYAAYGPEMRNAHTASGPHVHNIDVPILHYGWCRNADALALSQARHKEWYADGGRLDVVPLEALYFHMADKRADRKIKRYTGTHPAVLNEWMERHYAEWHTLNAHADDLVTLPPPKSVTVIRTEE